MSDLIRQLRHGGPMALAAAKRLLEAKPKLTLAEAAEVKLLLPQLKDLFGANLSEGLSTMLSGLEVAVPVPVELLMPELAKVKDPEALPQRFTTDLQLVRPQLTNHPALTREEKAARLFAFLVPFAAVLAKLPPEVREQVAAKLLERAQETGFAQLVDVPTKRDGVEVAKQLFQATDPKQFVAELKLDAPTWEGKTPEQAPKPEQPQPQRAEQPVRSEQRVDQPARAPDEAPRGEQAAAPRSELKPEAKPLGTPQATVRSEEREAQAERGRTSKRLGPQMLWNALHLFRDDGRDGRESAAQREEGNRLAVGMLLALGLLLLIALLVVAMKM